MRSLRRDALPRADSWGARICAVALVAAVCFPFLGRGYALSYDLVFPPSLAVGSHGLGLDGSVPRSVPADFLVALAAHVVTPWLLEQVILVGVLLAGAVGAWRLAPAETVPGAAATAVLYTWNPYLAERLGQGHWSLLVGWAALPWLARHLLRAVRDGEARRSRVAATLVVLGVAAASAPTAGVLTAGLVLVLMVALPFALRERLLLAGGAVLLNAAWWLPGALSNGDLSTARAGIDAFALRAESPLGSLASAISYGGIWNGLVVPASRSGVASVALGCLLVAIAVFGITGQRRVWGPRPTAALWALGAVGLALAVASAVPAGRDLSATLVAHVPGLGIVRDAQKWLAWWLLPTALAFGSGLEALTARVADPFRRVLLGLGVVAPLCALPGLAAGVSGQLHPSHWPAEFKIAARVVDAQRGRGAVLVLPWHAFRSWHWNDDRTVLDPWQRMLSRDVVVRDDLELVGRVVPGEDPLAASVTALGADPRADELRALGIRYVVVDKATAGQDAASSLPPDGTSLYDSRALAVLDLGPVSVDARQPRARVLVVTVDALAAGSWAVALGFVVGRRSRLLALVMSHRAGEGIR
jgi:hypothetical protein